MRVSERMKTMTLREMATEVCEQNSFYVMFLGAVFARNGEEWA